MMMSAVRKTVRRVAGATVIALLSTLYTDTQPPAVSVDPAGAVAISGQTVHLRKMHLVRPDLIPYPIPSAFYC